MALLEASGIGKNFGETHVLKDISLDLEQGEALPPRRKVRSAKSGSISVWCSRTSTCSRSTRPCRT